MPLNASQLAVLKADIAANVNTIPEGMPNAGAFVGMAINAIPDDGDGNLAIATWYNLTASPDYWVWATAVNRTTIYHQISPDGAVFDWQTFKNQSVTEQNAWTQMFMGDAAPFHRISLRNGVFNIFSGSAAQNAQRAHIFANARKKATNGQKLFSVVVATEGSIAPVANNGNNLASALGSAANPAVMTYEGNISAQDVDQARDIA